jgi:N-methyl-L-proline demethylase
VARWLGDGFIIGVRYTGDELLEGGIGKESGLEISRRLAQTDVTSKGQK